MPSMRSPEGRAKSLDDALTWVRNKDGADVPELEPFKIIDQLLPTKPGQSSEDRAQDIENSYTWLRENGADIVEDKLENTPFQKPGDLKLPRDRRVEPDESLPVNEWSRQPNTKIPLPWTSDDDILFDRPADIGSIPRDGKPKNEEHPETVWQRTPNHNILGIPTEDDIYDRPGDVKSVPRDGKPTNEDHPETIWQRTPNNDLPGIPNEDDVYNRPGDVKSVPRDGKPKNEDHPETIWQRTSNDSIPGMPNEDDVYNRTGDVKSVPRDGKPKNEDHPETVWQRT